MEINQIVKDAHTRMQDFKINTFIASIRILFNLLEEHESQQDYTFIIGLQHLLLLLWPVCPQITDNCYQLIFNDDITNQRNYNFQDNRIHTEKNISVYLNNKLIGTMTSTEDEDKNKQQAIKLFDIKYTTILMPNKYIIKFIK